jgi:hypothetical protein
MMVCPNHAASIAPQAPDGRCAVCHMIEEIFQKGVKAEREKIVAYLRDKWHEPEIAASIASGKQWGVSR